MMGRTHLTSGILAADLLYPYLPEYAMATSIGIVIGSLLPDIDEPGSIMGRALPFISIPYKLIGCILRFIGKTMPGILKKPFKKVGEEMKHRHFTHNGLIILLTIAAVILYIMNYTRWSYITAGLATGSLIHAVFDKLNIWIKLNGLIEHTILLAMWVLIINKFTI